MFVGRQSVSQCPSHMLAKRQIVGCVLSGYFSSFWCARDVGRGKDEKIEDHIGQRSQLCSIFGRIPIWISSYENGLLAKKKTIYHADRETFLPTTNTYALKSSIFARL